MPAREAWADVLLTKLVIESGGFFKYNNEEVDFGLVLALESYKLISWVFSNESLKYYGEILEKNHDL